MKTNMPNLDWLDNPEIYQVNRLPGRIRQIEDDSSECICLNGAWAVDWFPNPRQAMDAVEKKTLKTEKSIQVPGHLQLQGFGEIQYLNKMYPWDGKEKLYPPHIPQQNPSAVYTTWFLRPVAEHVILRFDGVESCCFVWVNDVFVGYSEDSFSVAEFEITDKLADGENSLRVMVPQFCSGSWLEDQDFFRFSGIFRDVSLLCYGNEYIWDVKVHAGLDEGYSKGSLSVETEVKGEKKGLSALVRLRDSYGELVLQGSCSFSGGKYCYTGKLENPDLWTAETPVLYKLEIELRKNDDTIQASSLNIGFRKIEIRDKIILLNGRRVVFRGVNRHEFHPRKGRVLSVQDMENEIRLLKQYNFNALRTSHYPNHWALYDLCDRYGVYVIDETNLETHGTWEVLGKAVEREEILPKANPQWREAVLDRAKSLYERDKNHPSILFWSCGNESSGGKTLYEMSQLFREWDPNRLVHYEGVFNDRSYNGTSDVESRMYAKPEEIEDYLSNEPSKPFICCEYAHNMGNSLGNLDLYISLEDRFPQYQGGFIWDFIDQCLYATNFNKDEFLYSGIRFKKPNDAHFCANGLFFADLTPTPALEEAKYLMSPLGINCEDGVIRIKNRNFFTTTEGYQFIWRLLLDGRVLRWGSFSLCAEPGEEKTYLVEYSCEQEGEYVLECSGVLKNDTLWAPSGFEIGFGQGIVKIINNRKIQDKKHLQSLINCDFNTGAAMQNSHGIVSCATGELISWCGEAGEMLDAPLRPEFWRAPTDNDIGAFMPFKWHLWKTASLYQLPESYNVLEQQGKVVTKLVFPGIEDRCSIEYVFCNDDKIEITVSMYLRQHAPCFGVSFAMPKEYGYLRWYGNTQQEAYCDRKNGRRLGLAEGMVIKQMTPYEHPQECGNKTDLRWLEIKNKAGKGIRIKSEHPFEASVLPYTAHEIENAGHASGLPPHNRSVVRIIKSGYGVGGDDSWGSHVHPQYRGPIGETSLKFSLQILK